MSPDRSADSPHGQPWLSIVGIGEDGLAGLGELARRLVGEAEIVFGGKRHLELAAALIKGQQQPWPTPFDAGLAELLRHRGRRTCILASGDPFLYGVGATVARKVPPREMIVVPAPSSFSLAAARMAWPLATARTISLHGRQIDLLRPHLHPGARILALTSDENGPHKVAGLMTELGFGPSMLTVLEALGGGRERIRSQRADAFAMDDIGPLNLLAIEVEATAGARIITRTAGLPDHLFEHDGLITKREIRAVTLSALAPRMGELLWDIGSGSGSVAIEWMLADPSLKAVAIEGDRERAARIRRNAVAFGVPGLDVVEGWAPAALRDLPRPAAIFVGGGGSDAGVMEAAMAALASGGRLVANAVTLEMEAVLFEAHARHGGDLIRLSVSRAGPLGSMKGWKPALPIMQWSWVKP